jgi:hypothetical protein
MMRAVIAGIETVTPVPCPTGDGFHPNLKVHPWATFSGSFPQALDKEG